MTKDLFSCHQFSSKVKIDESNLGINENTTVYKWFTVYFWRQQSKTRRMLGCLGSFLLFHYVSAIQPATRPPPQRRPAGGSGAVLGLHDLPPLRLCCVYIYGVLGAHYEQNNTNSDNGKKKKRKILLYC